MAEMQRFTGGENSETDEGAGNAAEAKLVVAAAALRREEARQALEKATVEAERAMPAAQAGAEQETARPKAEADARIEEAEAHKVAESKPKSVAEVREKAERAEASLKLSEQDRKSVQVALNSLGHHIPAATGYFGPRTRRMIAAWQKAEGLPESGYLTEAQVATLRQKAAPAFEKYDETQRRGKEDLRRTE